MFPTTPILETFTGTNGTAPPSANWTATVLPNLQIQGNQGAPSSTASTNANYWNVAQFTDCETYVDIITLTVNDTIGVIARLNPSSLNGYVCYAGVSSLVIAVVTGGADSTIATFSQTVSNGDGLGLRVIGKTLYAWYRSGSTGTWNNLGSVVDATYTGAGYIAADINPLSNTLNSRMDNFGGGPYGGGMFKTSGWRGDL